MLGFLYSDSSECFSVPASWTSWTSWSPCSQTCGAVASRRRSRTFFPGRHGGKTRPDEALKETQNCSESSELKEFPTPCPKPAHMSQTWESWSPCTETCYPEKSQPPTKHRKRECIKATFSNNWKYNININNCTDLSPVAEIDICGIQPCPGENTINDKILSKFLDALVSAKTMCKID